MLDISPMILYGIFTPELVKAIRKEKSHLATHRTYNYPPFTEIPCKECAERGRKVSTG